MQSLQWHDYHDLYPPGNGHKVSGVIKVARDVESPQLHNRRDIFVYLPPSYAAGEGRYPVLYMHDGQNLFDPAASFAGEWRVDETLQELALEDGLETIVVGIPNMGPSRLDEYSPFIDVSLGGGQGKQYVGFVANTLKPLIDHHFRTLPQRRRTGIMGSSMGGLISLYAFFHLEDVFGFAGVMSPSLWYAKGSIYGFVENASHLPGRIYLDAGTREMGGSRLNLVKRVKSRRYYAGVRRMKRILVKKGYRPVRDIMYVEEKGGNHSEAAWARRLPNALRFFIDS